MKPLDANKPYTFSQIGKLNIASDDLLAEYGYSFSRNIIELESYTGTLDRLTETRRRIDEILFYIDLTNEAARREVLIAPVITDIVHYTHAQLRIEYSINVSNWLQGNLDYFLKTQTNLLVVEAKQEDITKGFNQMAVEMISLDQWEKTPAVELQPVLVGAVTTGELWRFGTLNRQSKHITQDLSLYRVPGELEMVERILSAILINHKDTKDTKEDKV